MIYSRMQGGGKKEDSRLIHSKHQDIADNKETKRLKSKALEGKKKETKFKPYSWKDPFTSKKWTEPR